MKHNIGGRDIEIYLEPTVRTVEMVIAYDEKLTQDRLKQYIPDLSELTEEDKKKEINQLIQERIQKDPDMMTSFASRLEHIQKRRATEEQTKTIMLVTGMTPAEIMDIPLKTLYTKCHEVLGGTAGDFFAELQTSSASNPILTEKKL